MIQSFDFLIHAKNSPELKEQIIKHMQMEEDGEIMHYNAIIKFDSKNKMIREEPWLVVEKEFKIFR